VSLSILTVTYNSLTTLKEAYASLLGQSFKDWEWIVQDGGSTDGTLEWLESLSDTRVNWVSEKDHGIYDALNKAVGRAKGEWIGLLHSDDLYPNAEVLSQVVAALKTTIDGVYGDLNYVLEKDTQKVLRHWQSEAFSPTLLRKGWMPPHPTLFLRKEVYAKVGGFDTRYRIAADYDFILRVFQTPHLKIHYLPQVLMLMRQGGASSKLSNLVSKSKEDLQIMRANGLPFPLLVLFRKVSGKFVQFYKK
jgi:glycosyltransferase involved in cell wall biosynthesis